ncbi:MAG: NYN domain-containing protein [Clostridiales bacterium]|jgi:hypothetical protein|nr:NYN domain-containing protein [Clostridiales bacterium]
MEINDRTIALLIDSDNISKRYFEILIDELNKFGNVTYKRIYGDFTSSNTNGWKPYLLQSGISPIQQYSYTREDGKVKMTTDAAMIIDAMDIMYKGKVDCICLATSDSDFTKLATRFREENYVVIGAGEKKTPQSFRAACDRFLLMDVLLAESEALKSANDTPCAEEKIKSKKTLKKTETKLDEVSSAIPGLEKLIIMVEDIIKNNADIDGWASFGQVMNDLYKRDNSFNPNNYGVSKKPINFFKELPGSPFVIEHGKNSQKIKVNAKNR